MKKKIKKVSVFFKLFHKLITIIIYYFTILFKGKQQHTGEQMIPSRKEPVHDSPGARKRGTSNYIFF
jgi:hypothetical protein